MAAIQTLDARPSGRDGAVTPARDKSLAWAEVRAAIATELSTEVMAAWFGCMDVETIGESTVTLSLPTRFLRNWVNDHYHDRLLRCWQVACPDIRSVHLMVRSPVRVARMPEPKPAPSKTTARPRPRETRHEVIADEPMSAGAWLQVLASELNPRFTLATLVRGAANRLVVTAAEAQVTEEGPRFSPFCVFGPAGAGKTHLAQGIAAATPRAVYFSAERFELAFGGAVRANRISLASLADAADLVVVDDTHRLTSVGLLGHVAGSVKRIVIVCDRPPVDVFESSQRLISLIGAGVALEVAAPAAELRRQILQARLAAIAIRHPGFVLAEEVITAIVAGTHDGRDLEAVVQRLLAQCAFSGGYVDLALVGRMIEDLVKPAPPSLRLTIERIQRVVAQHFHIARTDLLSHRRTAVVVRPRQVAMYLAKKLTLRSLPEIGRRFGGRDHTTVLHAVRKIEALRQAGDPVAADLDALERLLAE